MSQSLYHRISAIVESTLGTTPATPAMLVFERSSFSPVVNAPKQLSATVRSDGNIQSSVAMNRSASCSRTQELVYPTASQALLTEIVAGLRGTEAAQVTSGVGGGDATDNLAISSGGTTVTRTAGSFITDGFQPGDVVQITNATATADNRTLRVSTVAEQTLTFNFPDSETWATTDAQITLTRGARTVNGTTNRSYSIEEVWTDTEKMMVWTGQRVAGLSFGFAMGGKGTYSASYVGVDGTPGTMASSTVGITGATYTDPTVEAVFDPTQAIEVVVNDATIPVQSCSINLTTNARPRHSTAGGAVPDAVPTGSFSATISLTAYAAVLDLLTQYRAGTTVPVWVYMENADGKALSFSLGSVVWDSGSLPMPGMDADAVVTVSGTATLTEAVDSNDQDWTVRFQRFE
jgi:hypothetical protein